MCAGDGVGHLSARGMARRDPPYASLLTGTLCLLIFVELVWVQLRFASVLPGNQRDAVKSVARDVGDSHAQLHQGKVGSKGSRACFAGMVTCMLGAD